MDLETLNKILAEHSKWLANDGGTRADLTDADLTRADLTDADLTRADLTGARLTDADLTGARLTDADLTDADLTRADLTGARLTDARLTGARLTGADLTDADLTDADLTRADLTDVRNDVRLILTSAPNEAAAVLIALRAGRVDGSTYSGECACLVGTIANARHGASLMTVKAELGANSGRPAEMFFSAIRQGDTPATNPACAIAARWVEEWIAEHNTTGEGAR